MPTAHKTIPVGVSAMHVSAARAHALPRDCSRVALPLDTEHFRGAVAAVGTFCCPISHPAFRDSGAISEAIVVFPRTSVWICHEGSTPFVADPNVVTIYNRAQRYERAPLSMSGDICDWFALSDDVAREIAASFDAAAAESDKRPYRFEFARSTLELYLAQRRLVRRAMNRASDVLSLEEEVVRVVSSVLSLAYARQPNALDMRSRAARRRRELVEQTKAEIMRTVTVNRSVRDIAEEVGSSVYHLCRIFHRYTGRSMHAYRTELRLRLLLERLEGEKRETLSSIAHSLGFASHAHLVRECRRFLGTTPRQVRELLVIPRQASAAALRGASPSA
jgi:AraC family transcriptional regulator